MTEIVDARYFRGYNISWNLNIFNGPKYVITCGECGHTFEKRVPVTNYPTIECPHCRTLNRLNLVTSR